MLFVAEDVGKIRPHIEQLLAIQYKQLTLESLFCVCMRFVWDLKSQCLKMRWTTVNTRWICQRGRLESIEWQIQ